MHCSYLQPSTVVQALQGNARIRSQAGALARPLAKLVEDGASKLAQRTMGVSALLGCCLLAAASHEADEVLKENKVGLQCRSVQPASRMTSSKHCCIFPGVVKLVSISGA